MNKRIQELIKQHGVNITIDGLGYGEGNVEGLAELIVKECVDTIKSNQWAKDNQAWAKGMNYSAELIKEHFGVEE
jgi:hypothetical protein